MAVYNHYKRVNYNLRNAPKSAHADDERTAAERSSVNSDVELNKPLGGMLETVLSIILSSDC